MLGDLPRQATRRYAYGQLGELVRELVPDRSMSCTMTLPWKALAAPEPRPVD